MKYVTEYGIVYALTDSEYRKFLEQSAGSEDWVSVSDFTNRPTLSVLFDNTDASKDTIEYHLDSLNADLDRNSSVAPTVMYYLFGYFNNAVPGTPDKEYFWAGPFGTREEASTKGKLVQKQGQPKHFSNWVEGKNKIFSSKSKLLKAANKVGINLNLR
jgi:hypothetical protein